MSLLRGDPAFDEIQRIDAFHHCSGERQAFFQALPTVVIRALPRRQNGAVILRHPHDNRERQEVALDRIDRHIQRLERNLGISTEAFAIFVWVLIDLNCASSEGRPGSRPSQGRRALRGKLMEAFDRRLAKELEYFRKSWKRINKEAQFVVPLRQLVHVQSFCSTGSLNRARAGKKASNCRPSQIPASRK